MGRGHGQAATAGRGCSEEVARIPCRPRASRAATNSTRCHYHYRTPPSNSTVTAREVGARARSIADFIGIAPELALTVERAVACTTSARRMHVFRDGWTRMVCSRRPVAKSRMRRSRWNRRTRAAGWPGGGRHEALSARLISRWLQNGLDSRDGLLADLLVHLVWSTHGSGRPPGATRARPAAARVHAQIDGTAMTARADLSIIAGINRRVRGTERPIRSVGTGAAGSYRPQGRPRGVCRRSGNRTGASLMPKRSVLAYRPPGSTRGWPRWTTVLDSRIRLGWTTERTPTAVLVADDVEPVEALGRFLARPGAACRAAHRRALARLSAMPRRVGVEAFKAGHMPPATPVLVDAVVDHDRSHVGRKRRGSPRAVRSGRARNDQVAAPPPAEVHGEVVPSVERLMQSLLGTAERVNDNGLGFDLTRMGSQADGTARTSTRLSKCSPSSGSPCCQFAHRNRREPASVSYSAAVQRGWVRVRADKREYRFKWPAWSAALDRAAIDAPVRHLEPG